jgi:hypothetical protein
MRKALALVGLLAALAIPAAALGVDINQGQIGQGCEGDGTYHFVAPGGSASSVLTVAFTGGTFTGAPTKVNRGTAQWTFGGHGTIVSASATNADRLVLSDFTCTTKKGGGKK